MFNCISSLVGNLDVWFVGKYSSNIPSALHIFSINIYFFTKLPTDSPFSDGTQSFIPHDHDGRFLKMFFCPVGRSKSAVAAYGRSETRQPMRYWICTDELEFVQYCLFPQSKNYDIQSCAAVRTPRGGNPQRLLQAQCCASKPERYARIRFDLVANLESKRNEHSVPSPDRI